MSKVFQEDLDFELDLKELGYNLRIIIYCLKYSAVEFETGEDTNFEDMDHGLLLSWSLPSAPRTAS